MIIADKVTKIYNSNKRNQVKALDNVTFSLPDTGMVFIVGKSGCGKSTLLNILGGLDKPTCGDVIADGNAFSSFSEKDFDSYRNAYLGFVFQDFCLLDGLTVRENVRIALDMQSAYDDVKVAEILDKVGLQNLSERKPNELSGGQKQRVAIARALIKSPKFILADEPTGNLDDKTGKQILDLLKSLSDDNLVVIVSHNRQDAELYADRIIELSDGQVISDRQRNVNYDPSRIVTINEKEINFNKGAVFTEDEVRRINVAIAGGKTVFNQLDSGDLFVDTPDLPRSDVPKQSIAPRKMSRQGSVRLFRTFAHKRVLSLIVTAFIIACLIAVLGVCQLFTLFDGNAELSKLVAQDNGNVIVFQKGYLTDDIYETLNSDSIVRATDKEILSFYDNGYQGNVYGLYNISLLHNINWTLQNFRLNPKSIYDRFYASDSNGVLVCDERFLTDVYGVDGKLKIISGEIEKDSLSVIVTDYFADSLIYYYKLNNGSADKYAPVINGEFHGFKVCAVIDTGYLQRYAGLIEKVLSVQAGTLSKKELRESADFSAFLTEAECTLNICYSFNADFAQLYKQGKSNKNHCNFTSATVYADDNKILTQGIVNHCYYDANLTDNQIVISRKMYADIMGISDETLVDCDSAIGQKITIENYDRNGSDNPLLYAFRDVEIADVRESSERVFWVSADNFNTMRQYDVFPYKLYFDNVDCSAQVYNASEELLYVPSSPLFDAVASITRAVSAFIDFFGIIVVAMCLLCAALLISFVFGSIKKNFYEIGVLRALGARTSNIAWAFVLLMLTVGFIIAVVSTIGLALGAKLCDSVLIEQFSNFTVYPLGGTLKIISFRWTTAAVDIAVVIGCMLLGSVFPFLFIRRVKPKEIICAKD